MMMPPNPSSPHLYMFHQSIRDRDHNVPHRDGAAAYGARAHETLLFYTSATKPGYCIHTFKSCGVQRAAELQWAQQRQYQGEYIQKRFEGLGHANPNQKCYESY